MIEISKDNKIAVDRYPDSIYLWITDKGIVIGRGEGVEEALRNLESCYGKNTLVERYKIKCYDGYYSAPTIIMHGNGTIDYNNKQMFDPMLGIILDYDFKYKTIPYNKKT